MTDKAIKRLVRIAERDPDPVAAYGAMQMLRQVNPTYHWCYEWDEMVICDKDPEYDSCICSKNKIGAFGSSHME
jgi:hypothetical protein